MKRKKEELLREIGELQGDLDKIQTQLDEAQESPNKRQKIPQKSSTSFHLLELPQELFHLVFLSCTPSTQVKLGLTSTSLTKVASSLVKTISFKFSISKGSFQFTKFKNLPELYPNITTLNLRDCKKVDDSILADIADATNWQTSLRSLNLSKTSIKLKGTGAFWFFPTLFRINN